MALRRSERILAQKKRRECSYSASVSVAVEIISCNYDLLGQILKCLPPKTLMEFKSVSKSWLSLISSRAFSLLWLQHHPPQQYPKISGAFFTSIGEIKYIPLTPLQYLLDDPPVDRNFFRCRCFPNSSGRLMRSYKKTRLIRSCNGLLLCRLSSCSRTRYQVLNPTTQQSSTILCPPSKIPHYSRIYLAFDPSKSLHYKIVLFLRISDIESLYRIHIYSSETKAWRLVAGEPFPPPWVVIDGVYFNGRIHWIWYDPLDVSTYFDVDGETFGSMPSSPYRYSRKSSFFGEFEGRLYVTGNRSLGTSEAIFEVAELESDYSKWSLKYHVDLRNLIGSFTPTVLGFVHGHGDGEEDQRDMCLVVLIGSHSIISYNLKNKTSVTLSRMLHPSGISFPSYTKYGMYRIHPHIETLAWA